MRCRTVEKIITDGETGDVRVEEKFRKHLETCERCRVFQSDHVTLNQAFAGVRHPLPSDELEERTLGLCRLEFMRLRANAQRRRFGFQGIPVIPALLGLVTVAWMVHTIAGISPGNTLSPVQIMALAFAFQNILMLLLTPLLLAKKRGVMKFHCFQR